MLYYSVSKEETVKKLTTSSGLNDKGLQKSIALYGKNTLEKAPQKSFFKRLLDAVTEPMLLILLFSACITLGVNIGRFIKTGEADFLEFFGIISAVAVSVVITMVMEGSSKKAFEALSKMYESVKVRVLRNGKITVVLQEDLAVGDIVIISSGDKIVADGRLIEASSLLVDESALTGESVPVKKDADKIIDKNAHLAERVNMVYSGTFITAGTGRYVVTGIGNLTEIGSIATEISKKNEVPSPLQQKLNALSKTITVIGAVASVLIFIVSIVRLSLSGDLSFYTAQDAFISAIVLIVAAVPEGLPSIVAVSLALNMIKLAKEKALIKKLIATETMGAVSVICSDKTGTLTENKMNVIKICLTDYCTEPENVKEEVLYQNFCVNSTADVIKEEAGGFKYSGSASEAALLSAYNKATGSDYALLRNSFKVINRQPFSSMEKKMETTVSIDNGLVRRLVKGAPEVVVKLCDLTDREQKKLLKSLERYEREAKRAMCFAHVDGDKNEINDKGLHFDGFAIISDSIRKDVYEAVKQSMDAGISVKMLTGDNILTATAIAKELKIIKNDSDAVNASDIEKLNDEELKIALKSVKVIARSTPSTKLRVVKALKDMGEVVAVTGDGINDAPAIKHADVGVSMGISGSEITKEASDVILLDDSFATIIKAVKFGRNVYLNLQRFILFQLSVNVSALLFIVVSLIFGFKTPFNTLQLLWINIIMDGPPALTLGLESVSDEVMSHPPVKRTSSIVSKKTLIRILINGVFIALVTTCQHVYNVLNVPTEEASGATFTLFILFQLFNAFNSRELGSNSILKNFTKNKIMLITFGFTMLLHVLIVTFFYKIFAVSPLSFVSWVKVVALALSIIVISEAYKLVYRIFKRNKNTKINIYGNKKGVIAQNS